MGNSFLLGLYALWYFGKMNGAINDNTTARGSDSLIDFLGKIGSFLILLNFSLVCSSTLNFSMDFCLNPLTLKSITWKFLKGKVRKFFQKYTFETTRKELRNTKNFHFKRHFQEEAFPPTKSKFSSNSK